MGRLLAALALLVLLTVSRAQTPAPGTDAPAAGPTPPPAGPTPSPPAPTPSPPAPTPSPPGPTPPPAGPTPSPPAPTPSPPAPTPSPPAPTPSPPSGPSPTPVPPVTPPPTPNPSAAAASGQLPLTARQFYISSWYSGAMTAPLLLNNMAIVGVGNSTNGNWVCGRNITNTVITSLNPQQPADWCAPLPANPTSIYNLTGTTFGVTSNDTISAFNLTGGLLWQYKSTTGSFDLQTFGGNIQYMQTPLLLNGNIVAGTQGINAVSTIVALPFASGATPAWSNTTMPGSTNFALASDGTNVYAIANVYGSTVTLVSLGGASGTFNWARTASSFYFSQGGSYGALLSYSGWWLWFFNPYNDRVTQLNATDGTTINTASTYCYSGSLFPVAVVGGQAYAVCSSYIYSINVVTAVVTTQSNSYTITSLGYNNGTAYIGDSYGRLLKYYPGPDTLSNVWFNTGTSTNGGGFTFVGTWVIANFGYIYAIDTTQPGNAFWVYSQQMTAVGDPIVSGNTVIAASSYLSSSLGYRYLQAFSLGSNGTNWAYTLPSLSQTFTTPGGIGANWTTGAIFVQSQSYSGYVYGLNATTGALLSGFPFQGTSSSDWSEIAGFVVSGGFIYCADNYFLASGNIYVISQATGAAVTTTAWSSTFSVSSPIFAGPDGTVYAQFDQQVYAYNGATGALLQTYTPPASLNTGFTFAGAAVGKVYIGPTALQLFSFVAANGAPASQTPKPTGFNVMSFTSNLYSWGTKVYVAGMQASVSGTTATFSYGVQCFTVSPSGSLSTCYGFNKVNQYTPYTWVTGGLGGIFAFNVINVTAVSASSPTFYYQTFAPCASLSNPVFLVPYQTPLVSSQGLLVVPALNTLCASSAYNLTSLWNYTSSTSTVTPTSWNGLLYWLSATHLVVSNLFTGFRLAAYSNANGGAPQGFVVNNWTSTGYFTQYQYVFGSPIDTTSGSNASYPGSFTPGSSSSLLEEIKNNLWIIGVVVGVVVLVVVVIAVKAKSGGTGQKGDDYVAMQGNSRV